MQQVKELNELKKQHAEETKEIEARKENVKSMMEGLWLKSM